MAQNFYYLLSKGKVGVERNDVGLTEKLSSLFELRVHTLCKIPKIKKLMQRLLGSWILGPFPGFILVLS